MAESFAHKWGQEIGNLFQASLLSVLQPIADKHGLYLDYQRDRKARPGKKVSWRDRYGNSHDLDYVFERGGTDTTLGLPAAFIEIAWRRYTKHSRNKAQEIEGAVLSLADTYSHLRPFLGIVLAGVFTQGSLDQLRSRGFQVLYFPYDGVKDAFASVGIDASFDEQTTEKEFRKKVSRLAKLSGADREKIKDSLLNSQKAQVDAFVQTLEATFSRAVQRVTVAVLHGSPQQWPTVQDAIDFLQRYDESQPSPAPALKYEVDVRYNNGDVIQGIFQQKVRAIEFLRSFA